MTMGLRIPCILTIHALLLCSHVALSLEDTEHNSFSKDRVARKRIDENGEISNEAKEDIELGRQYLESLWDSLDKNNDRKLEEGRMRYLESMMSMLPMSMTPPAGKPTQNPPSPTTPPKPTPAPVRGPTLPTREPIPTRPPTPAPSTAQPIAPSTAEPTKAPTLTKAPTPTKAPVASDLPLTGGFVPTGPCEGVAKDVYLLDVLTRMTAASNVLSRDSPFLDKTTPQGKAALFLLDENPSYMCSPTLIQRYALSTFYFTLGGSSWTNNKGWLGKTHECNWYGVECNEDKVATGLNLAVNNVIGELPPELSVVFGLQEIDLFYNAINGTLSYFEGLENLASLNLQENLLTGPAFPSSITTLPRLSSYLVSDNLLSGKMNPDIGSLTTLKELWAGNNEISGSIPSEIGDLRNLKTIYLNNNKLAGELPTELGFILLDGLVLNDNKFVGTIPNTIFNVASLDTLRLDGNFLSGTLPFFLGQLTDLTTFRVEKNNLDGQIPESIGYMTNLVNLGLNSNDWSGTIPDVFEDYTQLDFIDISNNNLGGTIPRTLFSIPTLRLAYMSNCGLFGSIPYQFANPPELRDLYLDGNNITGRVPPIASGQLEKLSEFLLHNNRITGIMPDSICDLRSNFILDDLWTDCGGPSPEIECEFPQCCNRCFESATSTTTRR